MKNTIFIFALFLTFQLSGQNVLTLEEAKSITLANNFGIQLAKNQVEITKKQADKKLNGYLPTVGANAGLNGQFGGSSQKFSTGQEASTSNAFTWGANAGVNANYTLIDKRRDLTLEQLNETLNLTNLQLKQTIENNLFQLYNGYYRVAQISNSLNALREAIKISRERLRRVQTQFDYGQGTGLTVLNTKVDIQRDSVNILNAKLELENEKRNLNVIMGRSTSENFSVEEEILLSDNIDLDELVSQSKKENLALKLIYQNLALNEMNLGIIEAEKKPTLNAGASYNFNYNDSPKGAFIDLSNSRGLAANLSLNWTIFDGSREARQDLLAMNLSNQKLQADQLIQQLERDIVNAWASYQNAIFVLQVEEDAIATAQENFSRTEEEVKFGRLTSLEFRQAQLNLLNAQTSLINAKFNAKLREVQLMQLAGRLIE